MGSVVRFGRALLPLSFACLLSIGACAMYDLDAFTEPEDSDASARADTGEASNTLTPDPTPTPAPTPSPTVPPAEGLTVVSSTAQTVTLAWDPPASTLTGYRVYYRVHETGAWMPLDDVAASTSPEYVVEYDGLGNGDFDFAVTALNGPQESDKHTSLDETAMPADGWYLHWQRNP